MTHDVLVYGSGRLACTVASRLTENGYAVIMAGRSPEDTARAASTAGVGRWLTGSPDAVLDDSRQKAAWVVVNCAGPYADTAPLLIQAAVRNNVHYVDFANETEALEAAFALHDEAVRAGVCVLCGFGFGVAAAELAAAMALDWLPAAHTLTIATKSQVKSRTTPGVLDTQLRVLARGPWVVRDGELKREPFAVLKSSGAMSTVMPVLTGDLVALSRTFQVPNIAVSASLPVNRQLARVVLPAVSALVRNTGVRKQLTAITESSTSWAASSRSLCAVVSAADSQNVEAEVVVDDTARLVLDLLHAALHSISSSRISSGCFTPYQALGRDHLQKIVVQPQS